MDRLHINYMVNETYMDLRTNLSIPDAYRDTVRRYAVNEDCMLENAPGVMTFFTTRSDEEPAITFFSRTDRHTTTVSVGRFSQCFGWEWGKKEGGPSEKFVDILSEGFYTEAELNPIAAADTNVLPPENKKRTDLPEVVLSPQVKKAILTAAMLRWLRSDPVLRIAVPKDADYDSYVIAAMKQIYTLCPLGLQAVAGFCSYMPDPEKAIPQVYFGFIPQEMADTKTLFLDESNQSALATYADGTRRDGLDRFINYICSCNEADLAEFLEELYTDVEAKGNPDKVFVLGTRNYQAIGDGLRIMSIQGTPEELMKEWQNFYDNIGRYSEKMQKRIKKHIAATVDAEAIVALYTKGLQDATDPDTVLRGLRAYNALCGDCPALADALWNAAIARLQEGGTPTAKISEAAEGFARTLGNLVTVDRLNGLYFLTVQSRLQKLLDEMPQETAAVVTLSEKLQNLEKELLNKQPAGYEELLEKLREKLAGLQEQQGDIAFMSLCKQLADLEKKPVENLSQIQDVISRSKFLEKKVCELPQDERAAQLLEKVKNFRKQLEELEHSSFTDLNEILLAINAAGSNYFTALNNVDLNRLRKLDAIQYKQVMDALDEKRPTYMSAYTAAFQKTCGKLALPILAKQNEFVLSRIMGDLAQFNYMTIPYEKGLDEKVWEKKLTRAKLLAREILGQEKGSEQVCLSMDGMDYEYEFFQRLVNRRLKEEDGAGMEQKKALENAAMSLINAEVFKDAKDLDYLTRHFAEYEISFQKLFVRVLLGFFGTDPKGNANAFSIMIKAAAKRHKQTEADSVRAMIRISEETSDADPKVLKQFQAFAEKLVGKDEDPFAEDDTDEPDDRGDRRSRGRGGKFEAPEKKKGWFGR